MRREEVIDAVDNIEKYLTEDTRPDDMDAEARILVELDKLREYVKTVSED